MRTHKRFLDIVDPTPQTDALMKLELAAGSMSRSFNDAIRRASTVECSGGFREIEPMFRCNCSEGCDLGYTETANTFP